MAYVSLLLGFVIYTGIAQWIGGLLAPLSSNPIGLIVIGIVVALPFLSPILGPGAAVAQIVGVLMGTQIATGALPVQYALPTLFAIDGQVGCDFIPVGLGLGEAKVETVEVGVPAVLFSRLITSPLAVDHRLAGQLRPLGTARCSFLSGRSSGHGSGRAPEATVDPEMQLP